MRYYVNDSEDDRGLHEVHNENCSWLPMIESKSYLGVFNNCSDAVREAKQNHDANSDGCAHGSPECHTG